MRPVCGGIVSCNYRISYFLSQFLKPLIKEAAERCDSTEDLLYRTQYCNENTDLSNCIVGSMDVEALYPSIDVDFSVDRCGDILLESGITFENADYKEIGLFLSLTTTEEERISRGVNQFCPTKKRPRGRKPTITASGTKNKEEDRWDPWNIAEMLPENVLDKNRMVVAALVSSIRYTMKNHVYTFQDKYFKQAEGGAIGVGLAGEVANVLMIWWDRRLKSLLTDSQTVLKLYSRYVDDVDLVTTIVGSGSQAENEERTMKYVQDIANSIHSSIRVTIDYPTNHPNKRLPVLDLEQWIQEIDVNGVNKLQLLHTHYMKDMANKGVIRKSSALTMSTKVNILVADLVRVMRNVSPLCDDTERKDHVQHFMHRMQYSGYSQSERTTVYLKARARFEKIVENDRTGVVPMYRSKFWNQEERARAKKEKRGSWYKRGDCESVMFVDATPNGALSDSFRKVLKKAGLQCIRVVERSGASIKSHLVKSNPFPRTPCNCYVCSSSLLKMEKIDCRSRDVVYRAKCMGVDRDSKPCQSFYLGETSRSIGERFKDHIEKYQARLDTSVFWLHCKDEHDGILQRLEISVECKRPSDAMFRQISEAVYIERDDPDLNKRSEWGNRNVPWHRKENKGIPS